MLSRRPLLASILLGACALPAPPRPPAGLGTDGVLVAAEAWHTDLCLPAPVVRAGRLAPLAAGAPSAAGFAFGFGLEDWMRADRPGFTEALGAVTGGPAVVSVRATAAALPAGAEESLALRLPAGGVAAIEGFILASIAEPLAPAPPGGGWLLLRARRRYSLGFTCNSWVMQALAEAGLPVPVAGIRLRGEAMAALRAEAARQAAG
ncbi:DUF2459 domain-containing protein [Roseomonas sp. CECT 9278]|uniref:DUF2459 domain-containing protein n=1 Tax=Roseomonas sp. CECT 9278 TaxID=2845823 RepID=UPI001E5E2AF7|nr:DUF2459 domain-containing protein [Roseomonas sp. CECT 9278]CAH0297095.1 hypothetical protein ROS9278_04416 [Roseomonas sp. CECT 9278]